MLKIAPADLVGFRVVEEVIVAVGKTETSLTNPCDLFARVVKVRAGTGAEDDRIARKFKLETCYNRSEICLTLNITNCLQFRLNCGHGEPVAGRLVHAGSVEIADFPAYLVPFT